jgi:multisubunit Na+/H+ antiporter MnhC subunit
VNGAVPVPGRSRRVRPSDSLLPIILTVQACLSLRLIWSNTAFGDEALYLWAGHLEIAHWLHGTRIPAFPAYFSGAPVIYPPLGALADSAGGLAGARILSLAFMLAATVLLWATASYLCGRRAAFFAAALWATLAPTQFLGAFATYDALSLLLTVTAAWCAVHAGVQRKAAGWMAAAAIALAGANATKYASGIFDPVVAGLAITTGMLVLPRRQALFRGVTLLGYTIGILVFLCALGGGEYVTGVTETTLARASGTSPAGQVLSEAWHLTAIVVVVAFTGVLLSLLTESRWPQRLVLAVLAGAALLVPLEQARIHTTFSLHKHVDFGAWFAAIAAGYAVDQLIRRARFRPIRWLAVVTYTLALIIPAQLAIAQARTLFSDWPNSMSLTVALRRLLPETSGPILVSTPDVPEYYLPEGAQWYRWSNLYTIRLLDGRALTSGVIGRNNSVRLYESKISEGFFSVVVINLGGSDATFNQQLLHVVSQNNHYQLAAEVPYWRSQIWLYEPQENIRYHLAAVASSPFGGLLTPVARPNPILGSVVLVVEISGAAALILMLAIRWTWRRGKASEEA